MRISRRFVAALIFLVFVLAIVPPENVFARFTALPDFYGIGEPFNTDQQWGADMSATCETVTVTISQPSNPENPEIPPEAGVEYDYATWSLEQVIDINGNTISVQETDLVVGSYPLDLAGGTTYSKTFTFNAPLEAGTPLYVKVRYDIFGGLYGGDTGVFDIGDLDQPYWLARARGFTASGGGYFCNEADASDAPTVYVLGDDSWVEGGVGAHVFFVPIQLDKPSTKDIVLDLESPENANLPDEPFSYRTLPTFNGYSSRGVKYGENVCVDGGPNCIIPDYSRHVIPAGTTYSVIDVYIDGNTTPDVPWYEPHTVKVLRATNAKLSNQLNVTLNRRNDDGCASLGPEFECGYTTYFAGGSYLDDRDKVSFVVAPLREMDVNPNTGVATFQVSLLNSTGAVANPYDSVVISYATNSNNVNSTPNVDYVESSGTLTFAAGEAFKEVDIPLIVDAPGDEDIEIFNVIFSKQSIDGFPPESIDSVTVGAVIPDTAILPVVTLADTPTIAEGDAGTTDFSFTVNLDKGAIGDQTVNYAVTGTGANPADAADFGGAFPSGSISIINGATSGTITIPVKGDTGYELDETFTVTISAGSAGLALGGTVSRVGTVSNDDGPAISIADVVVTEANAGASGIIFTVSAEGPVVGAQTVNYDVTGGAVFSDSVTIADGQSSTTITIPYDDDAIVEPDETFTVTISAGSDGIQNGSPLTATGTVTDDDSSTEVLIDGGFEGEKISGVPVAWTGKNTKIFRKDKQKCDKPEKNKFIAYGGDCAFLFKGNPTGERSMINQKIGDLSLFPDDARLNFSVYVDNRSSKVGHPFAKLIVKYENGDKEKVILRLPDADDYTLVTDSSVTIDLSRGSLDVVKVSFRNRLKSGKFFIDDASLKVMISGILRVNREILPLPEVPASFRD